MHVRLMREVHAPSGRGPGNGMFALQQMLRASRPEWLHVGGSLCDEEMPWFWCWEDRMAAVQCAEIGRPFVIGPNMLFADWTTPCGAAGEHALCNAASCRLQFTESVWYRNWILEHCGPAMRAPIVLWPYPIAPLPSGPQKPRFDLLIYEKSGYPPSLPRRLARRWPNSVRVRYRRFQRERLMELARVSRACVYLSDSDRGPLALAEILLSGCPAAGVPRGAPWLADDRLGLHTAALDFAPLCEAVQRLLPWDRQSVAVAARERFDAESTVRTILNALDAARSMSPLPPREG